MASIIIDDLIDSAELDRSAMIAITGGSSSRREARAHAGGFSGKGAPIELSSPTPRTSDKRLRHSKCARS